MKITKNIKHIYNTFTNNNFELLLVGGCVRDFLLSLTPNDFDMCTNATPSQMLEMVDKTDLTTHSLGSSIEHGCVVINNEEITTFRKDLSRGRHVDVEFSNILEDSKRRDFTINSMYFDISTSKIIDLHNGQNDLKNKVIRCVGNASDRLSDDPLRKLRALRFASQLDFNIDFNIEKYLLKDNSLSGVSLERINKEFSKSITKSKNVITFLKNFDKFGLFDLIFQVDIDKDFKDITCLVSQIHNLFINVDIETTKKELNRLRFETSFINKVIALKMTKGFFEGSFNIIETKKKIKSSKISKDVFRINFDVKIFDFEITNDFPKDLKGSDIGKYIIENNTKIFNNLLVKSS